MADTPTDHDDQAAAPTATTAIGAPPEPAAPSALLWADGRPLQFFVSRTFEGRRDDIKALVKMHGGEVLETSTRKSLILTARSASPAMMTENWISEDFVYDSIRDKCARELDAYRMVKLVPGGRETTRDTVGPSHAVSPKTQRHMYNQKDDEVLVTEWIEQMDSKDDADKMLMRDFLLHCHRLMPHHSVMSIDTHFKQLVRSGRLETTAGDLGLTLRELPNRDMMGRIMRARAQKDKEPGDPNYKTHTSPKRLLKEFADVESGTHRRLSRQAAQTAKGRISELANEFPSMEDDERTRGNRHVVHTEDDEVTDEEESPLIDRRQHQMPPRKRKLPVQSDEESESSDTGDGILEGRKQEKTGRPVHRMRIEASRASSAKGRTSASTKTTNAAKPAAVRTAPPTSAFMPKTKAQVPFSQPLEPDDLEMLDMLDETTRSARQEAAFISDDYEGTQADMGDVDRAREAVQRLMKLTNHHQHVCLYALYMCCGDADWALNVLRHCDVPVWNTTEDAVLMGTDKRALQGLRETKGAAAWLARAKFLR